MAVGGEPVMLLASFLHWIDVDNSRVEVAKMVEELMVDFAGDGVSFLDR
jgi:hypothetical protein